MGVEPHSCLCGGRHEHECVPDTTYGHVTPYGLFPLPMEERLPLGPLIVAR